MAETVTYHYLVAMSCEGCSGAVTRKLNAFKTNDDKLEDFDVDLKGGHVTVTGKPDLDRLAVFRAIRKTGKTTHNADEAWNEEEVPGENDPEQK